MADNKAIPTAAGSNSFKEAVCIDAGRIYDSCSEKDCIENLRVVFTDCGQSLIDQASSVKCKGVTVLNVFMEVEPVPFNRGFYSVDMTFFFKVTLAAYNSPAACPTEVCGIASYSKKVILYGSEGNVRVFSSTEQRCDENCVCENTNLPKATVQVVDPICLSVRLVEAPQNGCNDMNVTIPQSICNGFDGNFCCYNASKMVFITIGLFSIIQIERSVQMLIPAYDFSVPDKDCSDNITTDDPCEIFKRIKFPTNEFFPPKLADLCEDDILTV